MGGTRSNPQAKWTQNLTIEATYLAKAKQKALRSFNKKTTGSAIGPHAFDASFSFFDQLLPAHKEYILSHSFVGDQYIVIATPGMKSTITEAVNPFQTDSIKGFINPMFVKGNMHVVVTSTWCPYQDTQIPVLIGNNIDE